MVLCLRIQILLVGDSGVGKSSLLMRFTAGQFEESSVPTIGKDAVPVVGTCGTSCGQGSLSPFDCAGSLAHAELSCVVQVSISS